MRDVANDGAVLLAGVSKAIYLGLVQDARGSFDSGGRSFVGKLCRKHRPVMKTVVLTCPPKSKGEQPLIQVLWREESGVGAHARGRSQGYTW